MSEEHLERRIEPLVEHVAAEDRDVILDRLLEVHVRAVQKDDFRSELKAIGSKVSKCPGT